MSCWYLVKFNVAVPIALAAVFAAALAIGLLRWRAARSLFASSIDTRGLSISFGLFCLFYIVAYIALPTPIGRGTLPISGLGNNDMLNYFVFADYFRRLGPSNVAGFAYINSPALIYEFTPSIFYVIDAIAAYYRGHTLEAIMPVLYGGIALVGLMVFEATRRLFDVRVKLSAMVALAIVASPFCRYIAGNFFLSTIFTLPLALAILLSTASLLERQERDVFPLFVACLPLYLLIFYTYPPVLVTTIVGQAVYGLTYLKIRKRERDFQGADLRRTRIALNWVASVICSLVVVVTTAPQRSLGIYSLLSHISTQTDIGWPLPLISPAAVYGIPSRLPIATLWGQVVAVAGALAIWASAIVFWVRRKNVTENAAIFATTMLGVSSFAVYVVAFFVLGASYQQWKIGSYIALPLAFSVYGTFLNASSTLGKLGRKKAEVAIGVLLCVCIVVNIIASRRSASIVIFSNRYAELTALDSIPAKDLYVKMSNFSTTFFPVYYIKRKVLHLVSPSYFPQSNLDPRLIDSDHPLFVEGPACADDTHKQTIGELGCLYFSEPVVTVNSEYKFSDAIAGLRNSTGLSNGERWGVWSSSTVSSIDFAIDKNINLEDPLFINFRVFPYINETKGIRVQRVLFGLNSHCKFSVDVRADQWISIPLSDRDFVDPQSHEVKIEMTFPDAIVPHQLDSTNGDRRELAVGFKSLSVSREPWGVTSQAVPDDNSSNKCN